MARALPGVGGFPGPAPHMARHMPRRRSPRRPARSRRTRGSEGLGHDPGWLVELPAAPSEAVIGGLSARPSKGPVLNRRKRVPVPIRTPWAWMGVTPISAGPRLGGEQVADEVSPLLLRQMALVALRYFLGTFMDLWHRVSATSLVLRLTFRLIVISSVLSSSQEDRMA